MLRWQLLVCLCWHFNASSLESYVFKSIFGRKLQSTSAHKNAVPKYQTSAKMISCIAKKYRVCLNPWHILRFETFPSWCTFGSDNTREQLGNHWRCESRCIRHMNLHINMSVTVNVSTANEYLRPIGLTVMYNRTLLRQLQRFQNAQAIALNREQVLCVNLSRILRHTWLSDLNVAYRWRMVVALPAVSNKMVVALAIICAVIYIGTSRVFVAIMWAKRAFVEHCRIYKLLQ